MSRKDLLALLMLPLLALLVAGVANALAPPDRHLAWFGRPVELAPLQAPDPVAAPPVLIPEAPRHPQTPSAPKPALPRLQQPANPVAPAASGPLAEADSDSVHTHFQQGARFLDARRSRDYEAGHIAGAWSLPVWEGDLDARLTTFEAQAAPASTDPLVLYCTGGDCQDSHLLGQRLLALGYRNLIIYRDGLPDWIRRGWPVERGKGR